MYFVFLLSDLINIAIEEEKCIMGKKFIGFSKECYIFFWGGGYI